MYHLTEDRLTVGVFGQRIFTLRFWATTTGILVVNGMVQQFGEDYRVEGTTLTWLSEEHTLTSEDQIPFFYQV